MCAHLLGELLVLLRLRSHHCRCLPHLPTRCYTPVVIPYHTVVHIRRYPDLLRYGYSPTWIAPTGIYLYGTYRDTVTTRPPTGFTLRYRVTITELPLHIAFHSRYGHCPDSRTLRCDWPHLRLRLTDGCYGRTTGGLITGLQTYC